MSEILKEPPFFIVGAGRSGTTLVRSLLNAHSRLAVPPETHFMKRAYKDQRHGDDAPADFDFFWQELIRWRRFRDLGVENSEVLKFIEMVGQRDFKTVFAAMLRAYAELTRKSRAGEKTPSHHRHLDRLFGWFPDAQIIVIQRDPRAVVASQLRSPWVREQRAPARVTASLVRRARLFHVANHAMLWMEAYDQNLANAERDPRFRTIAYERLVAEPAAEVRGLCRFLGEVYEPSMLQDRTAARDRASARPPPGWEAWVEQHHAHASRAVSADGQQKWREELSEREVAVIEAVCGHRMAAMGYQAEGKPGWYDRCVAAAVRAADDVETQLRRRLPSRGY